MLVVIGVGDTEVLMVSLAFYHLTRIEGVVEGVLG